MLDRGDVHRRGQITLYEIPTQIIGVPRKAPQQSLSMSGGEPLLSSQTRLRHNLLVDPTSRPGNIQVKELSERASHHRKPEKSSLGLGAGNGGRSEDNSDRPFGESNNEHIEKVGLVRWIKLTTESGSDIAATFLPMNPGFPRSNFFFVESYSGVLKQRPSQSIYYHSGRPTKMPNCRQCVSIHCFPRMGFVADVSNLSHFVGTWIIVIRRCIYCYPMIFWNVRVVVFFQLLSPQRTSSKKHLVLGLRWGSMLNRGNFC